MIIAALVIFAFLLLAWLLAPGERPEAAELAELSEPMPVQAPEAVPKAA